MYINLLIRLGIGWDELVIAGICAHYNMDKAVLSLLKKEAPTKDQEKTQRVSKRKGGKKNTKNAPKSEIPTTERGKQCWDHRTTANRTIGRNGGDSRLRIMCGLERPRRVTALDNIE